MRRVGLLLLLSATLAIPASAAVSGVGLKAAIKVVRSKGYCVDSRTWRPEPIFKLQVLIGTYCSSADGYNRRAFFFYGKRYLGTDTRDASRDSPQEVWRDDRTIALLYILYRRGEPNCCPTGGGRVVRFRWNGRRLVALDRIPTAHWRAPLSR
jgi:hypothetical protein